MTATVAIIGASIGGVRTAQGLRAEGHYRDDAGQLCGAVMVNWPKALMACRWHVTMGTPFAAARAEISCLVAAAVPS